MLRSVLNERLRPRSVDLFLHCKREQDESEVLATTPTTSANRRGLKMDPFETHIVGSVLESITLVLCAYSLLVRFVCFELLLLWRIILPSNFKLSAMHLNYIKNNCD